VQAEGNAAVVEALAEAGVLLKEEQYAHKYPYDWRTKKPTIFRATSQWFASVEGFRCDDIPTSFLGLGLGAWRSARWRLWGVKGGGVQDLGRQGLGVFDTYFQGHQPVVCVSGGIQM
jgi:hypothetical protein